MLEPREYPSAESLRALQQGIEAALRSLASEGYIVGEVDAGKHGTDLLFSRWARKVYYMEVGNLVRQARPDCPDPLIRGILGSRLPVLATHYTDRPDLPDSLQAIALSDLISDLGAVRTLYDRFSDYFSVGTLSPFPPLAEDMPLKAASGQYERYQPHVRTHNWSSVGAPFLGNLPMLEIYDPRFFTRDAGMELGWLHNLNTGSTFQEALIGVIKIRNSPYSIDDQGMH